MGPLFIINAHEAGECIRHIHGPLIDFQRIGGQGIPLNPFDITVDTVGKAQDQGDADDADGPREGSEQRPAFLGQKIVQGEAHGGPQGHEGFFRVPF